MKEYEQQKLDNISVDNLKQIKFEDSTAYLCQSMNNNYQEIISNKGED